MKLTPRTFVIQWDLHAWVSVVASVLLFAIAFTGLFALLFDELLVWQEPALQTARENYAADAQRELDALLPALRGHAQISHGSRVRLLFSEYTAFAAALEQDPATRAMEAYWIDGRSGQVVPERTRLSFELYLLHFFYRLPGGMQIAGLVGIALLVSLVSGTLIHLKDLWRQRWQFRPSLRPRTWASDAHKALGVFGLPFTTVMAWSGAFLCLGSLLGAGLSDTNFGGDRAKVLALHGMSAPARSPSGEAGSALPLSELVVAAQRVFPSGVLTSADYRLYGDRNAWAQITFDSEPFEPRKVVQVDVATGEVLGQSTAMQTPSRRIADALFTLHFAHFGGYLLKALYALLALTLCAVTLTGTLIWVERRDAQRARRSTRFLERFTVGACAGLALAAAVYFAANRLLPIDLARRADWEARTFYGAWVLACSAAFLPALSLRRAAGGMLAIASLGYAASAFATWTSARPMGQAEAAVFVLLLGLGGCSALAAAALSKPRGTQASALPLVNRNDEEVVHADLQQTQYRL